MAWLDDFKIAIINQNVNKIIELQQVMPLNLPKEQLETLKGLIDGAIALLEIEKNKTAKAMHALKKSKEYASGSQKSKTAFEYKF